MVLLRRIVAVPIVTALLVATPGRANGSERTFDVVVYGGTASGVMAAIAAAREGMHVALLEPTDHLGGMVTGGVSATDIGDRTAIGGLALELYGRAGKLYEMNRWGQNFAWRLEPSVAGRVLESMLAETSVELFMRQRLLEHQGAILKGRRIVAVRTMTGDTFSGRVFIDSTYEGDLMAAAGVSFTWGREPQEQYSEELAGARLPGDVWPPVSARRVRDDNLLYGVDGQPASQVGGADRRVQPYMFRLCVTTEPANRISFSQPPDYREYRYALVSRYLSVLERWAGLRPLLIS